MRKYYLVFAIALLFGCEVAERPPMPAEEINWRNAIKEYRCTPVQFTEVEREFNVCNKTQWVSNYCFNTAIMRNCEKIKK
ncbi:MAG: hypothetical protein A2031_08050 [Deltaproteobacteria bacterium RBG_19FT_COMBO_43_11]|nr:MAG: hypothetical protein A2031_08050 [Deltaproteobacteria bacterium RBG_19FT_COMBO_43_11]